MTPKPSVILENPIQTLVAGSGATLLTSSTHILIVDDDELLRCMIGLLLQRSGFAVNAVSTGRAALDYLKDHDVDLLITDIYMPGCDGLELILALRRQTHRPRIIAMTGGIEFRRPEILNMSKLMDVDHELLKPFDGDALLSIVRKTIGETAPSIAC